MRRVNLNGDPRDDEYDNLSPSNFRKKRTKARQSKSTYEERNPYTFKAENVVIHQSEKDVTALGSRYVDFVQGFHGDYTVALCVNNQNHFEDYTVRNHILPATRDKPERQILVIEGLNTINVWHDWLFFKKEDIHLVNGRVGEVQAAILDFLRHALADEINEYRSQWQSLREAKKLQTQHNEHRPIVSNGVTLEKQKTVDDVLPLTSFSPMTMGSFNFNDGQYPCIVTQSICEDKATLTITSLHQKHELAQKGVLVTQWMRTDSLKHQIPHETLVIHGEEFFTRANLMKQFLTNKLAFNHT